METLDFGRREVKVFAGPCPREKKKKKRDACYDRVTTVYPFGLNTFLKERGFLPINTCTIANY